MMKNPIKDEIDYMLAQAQAETDIARGIVDELRLRQSSTDKNRTEDSKNYYEEKLALKMLSFFEEEERVVTLYAEAKKEYPLLAELMENKRPYLKEMLAEAKRLYEKNILGK